MSNIQDKEVERLMSLSHDEIIAEIKARGEDPVEALKMVNAVIMRAKRDAYARQQNRNRPTPRSLGPYSPFFECPACKATSTSPLADWFPHKPECPEGYADGPSPEVKT